MRRKIISSVLACLLTIGTVIGNGVVASAADSMTVDCNSVIRGVTHCANGSLYGITENTPYDINEFVAPLHPYVLRNPARGGNGNQHPYGDAIKVARRLSSVPSARVSIDLADMLPYWPYRWPGMNGWLNQVRSFINDKKASGCNNWYGYEIWNEPDGTFKNNGVSFEEMWKQTYGLIKSLDPHEKIIGPCDSWYNGNRMRSFLQYCKANNCIPDIMSWHELSGLAGVSSHIREYRSLERELGIRELPISINEYCDPNHDLEGQPGSSARFIGKFERYKIDSATISWWFTGAPGRLGSLLATDTQKGAGWYFYKWYGDMSGNMVNVIPPNDNSDRVDGAACVDKNKKYVSFIFGGPNDGTINTTFRNIPSFISSKAKVTIEKIDWVNKDAVSYGPRTISSSVYNVVNGQITVSMPNCNASSGYRIYITNADDTQNSGSQQQDRPVQDIQSGAIYKLINRNSGKALGVGYDSTQNGANVIQWYENGQTSQLWKITYTGNGYKITNVNANKELDVEKISVDDGANIDLWQDNGQTNQRWNIRKNNDGYYILENINSGKVLDVEKASNEDGANVIQWYLNNGYNQQWRLVRVN
ncbi:MAG: beta-xylosidase [Clostridium sp.]|nr:beta-xylosidase [Clostridium sp.]